MNSCNVIIIGSGPAGLFAAIWLERLGVDRIVVIDRLPYPAGGLLNDGKLNFDYRIGIDLDELCLDRGAAQGLMGEIKAVFVRFPHCRQVTVADNRNIHVLQGMAREYGVDFIAPEQWHWGTDYGKQAVEYLRGLLRKTQFLLGTEVLAITKTRADRCRVAVQSNGKESACFSRAVLVAPGRSGAYWFRDAADHLGVNHAFGPIDVGIRLELNRRLFDAVTDIVYDPKFIFITSCHQDRVRTFCTNPGGRVRVENYGAFKLINGDALHNRKTENTNFALINTVALTKPLSDTTEFGQMIARQFSLLGSGTPIVQRVGDFREGRRSSRETFNSTMRHFDFCKASYNAVPGDITLGMPARIIDNLWESLKKLDKVVPGILHPSTLLYAPEIKFFDTRFPTDCYMETNIEGIFVAGDGTGKSRGIVGAGISGILAARGIAKKVFGKMD